MTLGPGRQTNKHFRMDCLTETEQCPQVVQAGYSSCSSTYPYPTVHTHLPNATCQFGVLRKCNRTGTSAGMVSHWPLLHSETLTAHPRRGKFIYMSI